MRSVGFAFSLLLIFGGSTLSSAHASKRAATLHVRSAKDRNAEMHRALKSLQKAREDLMRTSRDYNGHRTKAVQAIDMAIDEIKQALEFNR